MRATILLLCTTVISCAAGGTYKFDYQPAATTTVGKGKSVVVIMPADKRQYVVSGEEPPSFVGELRSGYGIPYNVNTSDKRPFAAVVAETVQRDLEAAGFTVTMNNDAAATPADAIRAASAGKALAITIDEFKSDVYTAASVEWNLTATVYDRGGKVLATDTQKGQQDLPGSVMNPKKAAAQRVPPFFYERIHALITGNPKIVSALTR